MKQITCPHCADTYPDFDVAHVCSKGPYAPKLKPKMNERIKELAEQAGLKVNADGEIGPAYFGSVDSGYRKFAELIVRECADVELYWLNEQDRKAVAEKIREHFGVEG